MLESILNDHVRYMARQMVDSSVRTTRVFWRTKFFNATDAEANDPRLFIEILKERTP